MMKIELSLLLVTLLSNHFSSGLEVVCPPRWTQWRGGCYRFINQPRKSWDDARAACNTYELSQRICPVQTAHLVSIDSQEENNFLFNWWKELREPVLQTTRQSFWTGLNDKDSEGNFKSVRGKPAGYFNWMGGQPDNDGPNGEQNCVQVWKNSWNDEGKWDDMFCDAKLAFMCEFRCY